MIPTDHHFENLTIVRTVRRLSECSWGRVILAQKTEITEEKLFIALKGQRRQDGLNLLLRLLKNQQKG